MSLSEPRAWLIAYDIAEPRRLVRTHRFLKARAATVQYSVFVAVLAARQLETITAGLAERIDPRADDVRIYPLPKRAEAVTLGRQYMPAGIVLLDPEHLQFLWPRQRQLTQTCEPGRENERDLSP